MEEMEDTERFLKENLELAEAIRDGNQELVAKLIAKMEVIHEMDPIALIQKFADLEVMIGSDPDTLKLRWVIRECRAFIALKEM